MPSPNFSAYTIQSLSVFGPNVWKYDLYQWNFAPLGSAPPLIPRTEVGTTESIHSSYSGPQFNMNPYYGMTQKNGKLYGFGAENNTPQYQWPGQIFQIDQDWGGRAKTIYSGLTGVLPFGFQVCNVGGFAYDKANDCFTLLKGTTMLHTTPPPLPNPYFANGERYLHTWGVSHTFATPQLPFYSGVTCLLETAIGLAYRNSELYAVAYISGMTPGLTFQHINTNSGINTILSYSPLSVDSVINVSTQGWGGGDLTYDEVGDNFYFLSHNGTAKIDPQFYTWEAVPSTATTQQYWGGVSSFEIGGFEIIEPSVTTTTTLCTEIYSVEVSPDYLNATISLCDSACTNCDIVYVSGCTAPVFGWCTADTTCFDLTLECCKTYCIEVSAPGDNCSYTEYVTSSCPSTTTTTTYTPPEPTTTTTTTECVCVYPVEYFNGTLSGITYLGDTLEGTYCNDDFAPFIYNHISNPINSILTHGILIKQTAWGSLPISNNWWSLIRDIGASNYLLVGTGSTLTTVYKGIPPLVDDFLVVTGQCECTTTTTLDPSLTTTTTLDPAFTTTTTTTLHPCDFGPVPLTGDCPTTTTTTVPPTTTTTTADPCDFGIIPLTGDCVTSTTTLGPRTTTTTTIPCCYECCLITGDWEIINTGTTGNNSFYSIHKTSPHNQATLPIALKDPTMWGALPHMFFQGFAKRTTNNFLYGAFLEHKFDNACNGTFRYDLHIYQVNPNTGSGALAQTYTGYDACTNGGGIRTDELGEGCLGYDSLNDKLIFIPYNNTVHPVYQIQPWVNGNVTYLGDFTVMGSTPNQYAHMSGLSNIPGTNSFYCYLDECSFTPTPPGGTVNCNSTGGYVCGFDTTTLNSSILPLPINPLPNSSIAAGLLYDCDDLYIVRRMPSCSGCTPQQYTSTWIDHWTDQPGECAGNIQGPCAVDPTKFNFGCSKLYMSFNEFDKDGNLVTIDMLTGDTSCPFIFTITDPATGTFIGQWEYDVFMDGNYPAPWTACFPCCVGGMDVGFYDFPFSSCGGGSSPCMNGLIFTNPVPSTNPIVLPDLGTFYEIKVEYGGMGTACNSQYTETWIDGQWSDPGQFVSQGIYDVGVWPNPAGFGTAKDEVMGAEYMVLFMSRQSQSGQVFNGDNFTASTNPWNITVYHPNGSGTIIGSWEYDLVRYPTGPGYPVALCDATPPVQCVWACQNGAFGCNAGAFALHLESYAFWFKNPVPSNNVIDLSDYGPGSSHFNDMVISWGENSCCSGGTENLVLTKYPLPSGPLTNTILGTISGVTALAGLECAGDFCETPENPCPTTTTTTIPVSTTTTTDPCAPSTTTTTTTEGPPTTTTTTYYSSTTTTTTLLVPCDCECPPNPPSQCPCIFSGTNIYVFYDGSPSFSVNANQIANNVVLPWFNQFIAPLAGYVGCLYQATTPFPTQATAESWLRFSRYPWEGTNAFTPTAIAGGGCASGLDMPIAANINDPNAVVISFVNESAVMYHDYPWPPACFAPSGDGTLNPPNNCSDWRTNQPQSWPTSGGALRVVPTHEYLKDFDSFMNTYNNGIWDQIYGTPGNNGSFNSFVYTLPVNVGLNERLTELNAYAAVEGRVVAPVDFVDIGMANNGGGLYTFSAIEQTNPYCEHECLWDAGYGPGHTPEGRCLSGLTHFGFVSVHSHEYLLSNWLGSTQNNNIGIATLSATVCFNTACTSGITVEECCITGLTAEQWIVDNPSVVSGLIFGETFNDLDHNACYKVIAPPNPPPTNGITLNPQSPTFGIDNCGECMASGAYCEPTTTTTTKIYHTTTTTSTTIRRIWGVERCCCPTGETVTILTATTVATPINFENGGARTQSMSFADIMDNSVVLNQANPQVVFVTTTTTFPFPHDITLHFYKSCHPTPGCPHSTLDGTPFCWLWEDTQGNAPMTLPYNMAGAQGIPPSLSSALGIMNMSIQLWMHLGSPNVGDLFEIDRELQGSLCWNGHVNNCYEYMGTETRTWPTDPWFTTPTSPPSGFSIFWLLTGWWLGNMSPGCCSPSPSTTGIPCTFSINTFTRGPNLPDCTSCCSQIVPLRNRTFHIWEECVINGYFPFASQPFPPGLHITYDGIPGAIATWDYTTATGLDDVEHNSNLFYNWVGAPGLGEVVTIHEAPPGTIMNSLTLCLKYMGPVTTSAVPWTQQAWHIMALMPWSTGGTNSDCCVCTNLQANTAQSLQSYLPIPTLTNIIGSQLNIDSRKIPVGPPTTAYYEPTRGAKILNGWEDISVHGLAYLVKVWTKNGDQYIAESDATSCAYIDKKAFSTPPTTPTTTYFEQPTTTTTTYFEQPTTTTTTYFGQTTTTTTYYPATTTTTYYPATTTTTYYPATTTTTYFVQPTTTTTYFGQTTTTTTYAIPTGGPLSNFVGNGLDGTASNAPRRGDFINLYQDNAYGFQSIEILDIVDQSEYESGEVKCSGQRLIISSDIEPIPLFARFRNLEVSLSQSPILSTTTTIYQIPPSHMWETCWVEESDYIPNLATLLNLVGKTWGVEYYASPNYIGSACYDIGTNPSTTPSSNFIANSNDFYQYMGAPSIGETVRFCYWHDNVDFNTYTSNNQPTRIPGMACACLRYMGVGVPNFYDHLRCEVTNSNMGTTCSDCDIPMNTHASFGGSLTNKGITWDNVITNTGLNSCCCTDEYNTGVDCMPPRTYPNPCSGYTYTDLSGIPIGGTWYDATSGECFTHIADPGLTYFDFTAPVPNPGGYYLDCEECHDMNEIICDPTTTTTTRPREVWGIKPCCCDEKDMVGTVPNVGDTGEAGGIIFHVDSINNTIYEVAPKALEIGGWGMRWGCWGTNVLSNPTLGTSIGMGKTNTNEIFATACSDPCPWKPYLQSLTVTTPNGIQYQDWFAPSYDEWLKLWFNIGPGQSASSPLYNLADIDDLKPFSGATPQPPYWITSSENPNNPTYDTINIGLDGANQVLNGLNWYNDMGDLQKNFPFFWLRPIRSYNYQACSGYTTTDISLVPIGNTWYDPLSNECYERIAYPGPINYTVNVPLNGPYEDCDCCEITHGIVSGCVTTTTTIWDPPKTTTTTTNRPTTTTTTRPAECYGIKPCCCLTGETWTIGSTGPSGGIVFYHDGDGNYLEMAPYDINVSNYNLPQNIIAADATDSAHTYTIWGCMNLYISGTSREIFDGKDNTLRINNACTPNTYGYPCCPSCTTDVNWIQTNPCSGSSIPFTYNCVTIPGEGDGPTTFSCTKEYIGTDVWPNPGSNLDASNITLHSAAHICSTFSYSGNSDWYLPTIKEMNEMYNNLVGATGGQTLGLANPLVAGPPNETFYSTYNFAEGGHYWTSSECDASRVEHFPMFNAFNNIYLSLGISDGPNYPTGTPCSGIDSIFPELFASELHSKSLIPYPDTDNNIIQGSPKYIRPVRKFTSSNLFCSGCTKTDLSFMPLGQVFYDLATNMCYERIAIPGPDLYTIAVVPSVFYDECEGGGGNPGCLDVHKVICTTTTHPPVTTTTTAWSATTTTTTARYGTTTTTTTCQGLSACCPTDLYTNARWCGDPAYPGANLNAYNVFYDTLTNTCWDTIEIAVGPVISINYPPMPMFDCEECNRLTNNCTTTTTTTCLPFAISACCEEYVFSLTACTGDLTYPYDQTNIYEGQGLFGTINGVEQCYVVVPHQPVAPQVAAGFTYSFWCTDTVAAGDPPCKCSGCTDTTLTYTGGTAYPCDPTTTTTTQRCDNCICLSGISHSEIFYTGQTTSTLDDVCLTSADGTYCLEEVVTVQGSTWLYYNQNNCQAIGYYQIVPFQYSFVAPNWEISSWVVQWCDNLFCTGWNNPYQIATASTIVNTSIPATNPAWDMGQTVWEYIDNQAGPISVNPRNLSVQDPCYNYSGTSHTGCCTSYGLMTCCYDPLDPHWGEDLCCNDNQQWFNTVYDIPTLFSGTSSNPSLIPTSVIHIQCPDMCLTISDENYQSWEPVPCAPFLNLRSVDLSWSITNPNPCLECKHLVNDPCDCVTSTTTIPATTTTTTGPVTTTTTTSGPLGLEDCCDPNIQYVAAGALYTLLSSMIVGQAFTSTIAPCDCFGCWKIINNPVGPVQTWSSSPSFVSSSCAALNTATNYRVCCPVSTTTTTVYGTTTTTTHQTLGVKQCCDPYTEYIATGVILTWLTTNLLIGEVVYGDIITAPFSLQSGCWEFIANTTGPGTAVSISPTNTYSSPFPCSACTTINETAACTTTTTSPGIIGIEACCPDPLTGAFDQYVAGGAFEIYLNGLTIGQAFEITFNIPGVGDITGCYKIISNPIGLTVTVFVTPTSVYHNCNALEAAIHFRCCEQPPTTTTTTVSEMSIVKHCCTGDVYELVGDAGALSSVAGLNNNDTFRLVGIGPPFDGMACCFHKCDGCAPIVGPITGTFLFPVWPATPGPQCDVCHQFGQSDGCCPTTTTTTMVRAGLGLEACCETYPGSSIYIQYVPIGTLLSNIGALTLGTAHLFVLNGTPVCATVINNPIGLNVTGSIVQSPPTDMDCHDLITWMPPSLMQCCPVTTTTTCTPIN